MDSSAHARPPVQLSEEQAELAQQYLSRIGLLRRACDGIQTKAENALENVEHIDRISFRVKDASSFARKCLPAGRPARYAEPLREAEDQIAGRVLVFFTHDLQIARDRLQSWFSGTVEFASRRPESNTEFGYESDHYIVVIDEQFKGHGWDQTIMPTTFEIQIRTLFMHAYAEPQHDLGYKGTELSRGDERLIAWVAASAWGADRTYEDAWRGHEQHGVG